MYEHFYNLRERPFALSPDPEYLYLSRVHREALDSLRYGIESRAGFIVVTGEIGAGKTTLLQALLQHLDESTAVARVVNTTLEPRELLETIALEFGLETTGKSKPQLLKDLAQFFIDQRAAGRRPLLMIDEGQNLSPAAIEEVRLLSNLETEKSKLLQIVIAGQPDLRDVIASPALEQFRQRVAVSYHLTPLDAPDTVAYIQYRLHHAAIGEPPRFDREAAELVHRLSRGIPRIINVICDAALVFGYAEERRAIDVGLIREVTDELRGTGVLPEAPVEGTPGILPAGDFASGALAIGTATSRSAAVAAPRVEHAPVAARVRADTEQRTLELDQRERTVERRERELAARERELAQQRRVLMEEYRLLRRPHSSAAASAPGGYQRSGPMPAAVRSPGLRREGALMWLRRVLLGQGSSRITS